MANKFQVKRTTVSGRTPNTTNSGNSHFIDTGELALNLTDGKMFSSNGTVYFEIGANLQNQRVTNTLTVNAISANGGVGTSGQVLKSNGSSVYWGTEVADVGSASQILYRNSSNVVTTSSGLQYDGTSIRVNGNLESIYQNGDEGGEIFLNKPVTSTSITNGVTIDVFQNKLRFFENGGNNRGAYIDITTASNGVGTNLLTGGGGGTGTVTQVNTGVGLSGGPITATGTISVVANNGIVANSTGLFANAGTGVVVNATGIHVNSSYIGTLAANSATYVGGNTALDLRNYSDTVAGTAYTNATAFAANATNISSGTLDAARLPATVVQNTDSRTLSGNLVISGTYFNPSSNTVLLGNSIQRWVVSANSVDALSILVGSNVSINVTTVQIGNSTYHANLTSTRMAVLGGSNGTYVNSDMVLVSTTTGTSYYMGSGANLSTSGTLNIGTANATANGFKANNNHVSVGNSSVNVTITTAGITSSGGTGVNPSSNSLGTTLGTSTQRWVINANTGDFTGTVSGTIANMSTSVNSALLTVGTSFIANTTGIYHTGIINAASFSTSGFVGNTTVIAPTSNTILLGNSIGRFVISANTINASGLITGSAGANITGTANLVDVNISGNLTVSGTTTYVNTTNLNVGDNIVTLNADLTNVTAPTENAGLEVNRGSAANVNFLWNETSDSWTLGNTDITGYANVTTSVNSASLTVGSSFIANSTAIIGTGYANISTSVNSALLTVGTSFIANTTGAYHTGTINAASITIGSSSFIANSTAIVIADPLTANGTTGTSGQVLTSNGSTGAPYWADAAGASSGVGRTVTSYTGNGSNTVYGVSYTAGYLDVYLNGVRLILGTDFVATNGTDITFTVAPANGDNIDLLAYSQTLIAPVNARTVTNYTADGSTSTYSVTYDVGYLDVYVNGIRLSSGVDFTATNGSSVVFLTTPLSGDYIELVSNTVAPLQGNGTSRTVAYYTGDGSTSNFDINYLNGFLDVYVNGIKYKYGEDYTASNGSGISILSTPLSGDNIELVSYRNNANLSSYVSTSGDTMTGTLIVPVITSSGNVSGVNGYFTTINAASHTIGSNLIANTTGVYHTGTVNAASHTIGSTLIANTTGVYHTGTVNAASLTLGSDLIANASGVYHTGLINAASLSIGSGSFSAHSTGVVINKPLTANGSTGTTGQVLASNGINGSPYWVNPGSSVPNANTQVSSLGVGTPASGTTGEIRATDAITAYYSDRRLKENIKPIENAVEKVKQISGVTFTSNKVAEQYGYKNKNTQVGVIAQELELVLPQVVTAAPFDIGKREDGTEYSLSGENYKTVYYEKIVPLLIEAIKEQQAKIEQLESSLDQLSKRV